MNNFEIKSLLCLTISCSHLEDFKNIFINELGWEIFCDTPINNDLQVIYNMNNFESNKNSIILRSPESSKGMIRLINGEDRIRKKPRSFRWGGFEIVVKNNLDEIYNKLLNYKNFIPISPPQNYDFTNVQSNIHRAFSAQLPGGTHGTFTMKVTEPENRLFPNAHANVGHIFEIPLNTNNYTDTKNFYENHLGLKKILESISNDGPLHKSWNIPSGEKYSLGIFKSSGENSGNGSVEIHGCKSIYIDEDVDTKSNENLDSGACLVTFSVENIKFLHRALKMNNIEVSNIIKTDTKPYNNSLIFTAKGPNKEMLEFVEEWKN